MLKAVKRKSSADPTPGDPVPTPYPFAGEPEFPNNIGPQPLGMPLHACMGLNSCAASDRFGTTGHGKGQSNACAGQGYCSTAVDHTCHVQNACQGQGGCGLYGTADEMSSPGANSCQSLGSCATPINAERYSANGFNQGKSVWARARVVFEQNWPQTRQKLLKMQAEGKIQPSQPLPATLGQPPAAFANIGPSYLWISVDNAKRNNMTACGASGMSGAGGCS